MRITPEAKRLLLMRLGADRALSRAGDRKAGAVRARQGPDRGSDVEAAVGDAAELALDRIVMAAGSGRAAAALAECDRSVASGESPQSVIAALQRHFLRLHRMRGALDGGRSMDDVMRSLRPPPHFKQRPRSSSSAAAGAWPSSTRRSRKIAETAKAARLNSAMESTLAEHLLMELGVLANEKA